MVTDTIPLRPGAPDNITVLSTAPDAGRLDPPHLRRRLRQRDLRRRKPAVLGLGELDRGPRACVRELRVVARGCPSPRPSRASATGPGWRPRCCSTRPRSATACSGRRHGDRPMSESHDRLASCLPEPGSRWPANTLLRPEARDRPQGRGRDPPREHARELRGRGRGRGGDDRAGRAAAQGGVPRRRRLAPAPRPDRSTTARRRCSSPTTGATRRGANPMQPRRGAGRVHAAAARPGRHRLDLKIAGREDEVIAALGERDLSAGRRSRRWRCRACATLRRARCRRSPAAGRCPRSPATGTRCPGRGRWCRRRWSRCGRGFRAIVRRRAPGARRAAPIWAYHPVVTAPPRRRLPRAWASS